MATPEPDDRKVGQLYPVAKAVITPVFRFAWRFHVEGLDHVPATGPAIICPNHTSVLDSFFVPAVLPRKITYVGKAEYMDDWKTKHLFPAMGMIPIDRGGGSASERALSAAQGVLERGELFGIYPEGTRSPDGRLYQGKTGVARLALSTGAPVVPVGILDADIAGTKFGIPWVERPRIIVGEPLDFSVWKGMQDDRAMGRWVTDEVMAAIQKLTGQTYVQAYAASVKSGSMDAAEADRRVRERPGGGPPPKEPTGGLS